MDDKGITKQRAMQMLADAKEAARKPIEPSPESIEKVKQQYPNATGAEKWRLAQAQTLIDAAGR